MQSMMSVRACVYEHISYRACLLNVFCWLRFFRIGSEEQATKCFWEAFCYCGQRHLSDLSAAARVRWAGSERVSWSWYSDKQAYFHFCQPCYMEYFPNDVRPKVGNRNTRPAVSLWHNAVGGNVSRLICGERLACSSEAGLSSLGPRRPSCCGERSEHPSSSGVFEVVLL